MPRPLHFLFHLHSTWTSVNGFYFFIPAFEDSEISNIKCCLFEMKVKKRKTLRCFCEKRMKNKHTRAS